MSNNEHLNPFTQMVDPFTGKAGTVKSPRHEIEEDTNRMIVSLFASPDGLRLLDRWDDIYLRQPTCPVGCAEGYGYARSAVNEFIVKIRRIVNEAQLKNEPRYTNDNKPSEAQ